MNFFVRALLAASCFFVVHAAIAEPTLVFSRSVTIKADNGELTVPSGRAWKILSLPTVFNCPVGSTCPALYIEGTFRVSDTGNIINGNAEITGQQLNFKPLWIFAGSKIKVGIPNSMVIVQEYVASLDDANPPPDTVSMSGGKPDLPIVVTYRAALMGNSYVAAFTNQSNRLLAVMVTARNPSFGRQQTFRLDIAPNATREIGHLEGWKFVSGDVITVTHAEYAPMVKTIP
jgi:hypothetical protein